MAGQEEKGTWGISQLCVSHRMYEQAENLVLPGGTQGTTNQTEEQPLPGHKALPCPSALPSPKFYTQVDVEAIGRPFFSADMRGYCYHSEQRAERRGA